MIRKYRLVILAALAAAGVMIGYWLMVRTVPLTVDGESARIQTRALTVKGVLRSAGYTITEGDSVSPPANTWLSKTTTITLNRVRPVMIRLGPSVELLEVNTSATTPLEILRDAGFEPAAEDLVMLGGQPVELEDQLDEFHNLELRYRPAVTLTITLDGEARQVRSAASDLAEALEQAGISVRRGDRVSTPLTTILDGDLSIEIKTGSLFIITVDGNIVEGYSAAGTTGEALADAGVVLQGLDYSLPKEDEPVPADGAIRVVRVEELILLKETEIPYESQLLADDTLEIDQRVVMQAGAAGTRATMVKVRYEDGEEVSRGIASEMVLAEPVTEIVHYGTQLVLQTIDTPNGPVTFYLAVEATATSYSPCNSGVEGRCYDLTALGIPVRQGLVAMHRSWYNIFKGTNVYIPGYGVATVADIGYYPKDDHWVDLGYSDADYISWPAVPVTIYFLPPAPDGFSGVLP